MQENYCNLVTSSNHLSQFKLKSNFFSANLSKPTRKQYGISSELSIVDAEFMFIKKCIYDF